MSAFLTGLTLKALELSNSEKLLMVIYSDLANDDGRGIWERNSRLALKAGASQSTLRRVNSRLRDRGLIKIYRRFRPDGSQSTNGVEINTAMLQKMADAGDEKFRRLKEREDAISPPSQNDTPSQNDRGTPSQNVKGGGVTAMEGGGCHSYDTPISTILVIGGAEAHAGKKTPPPGFSSWFDTWWKAYPPHRRRAKPQCRDKWEKLGLEWFGEELTNDLVRRVENDADWKRGFIPNPKVFINQQQWEAEFTPDQPGKGGSYEKIDLDDWLTTRVSEFHNALKARAGNGTNPFSDETL